MALISMTTTQLGSSCTSSVDSFSCSKQIQVETVKTATLKVLSTSSSHCFSCKFHLSSTSSPSSSALPAAAARPQSVRIALHHGHGRAHSSSSSSSSVADSPFTERSSLKKSWGRGLGSNAFPSPEERDSQEGDCCTVSTTHSSTIQAQDHPSKCSESTFQEREQDGNFSKRGIEMSSQLPELREVLTMLRQRWEEEAASGKSRRGPGNVFLVGTGPGDPELLTVKALRLMQTADLVLYDRLVSTDALDLVHAGARLLYVGKTSGFHSRTQEEIHELLLNFADAGATVVRLKGGDPLVFGRGGEEMDFLQEQGIQVKVVPGITAASGIGAELGIPMTHRGAANSVRFLTGHSRKGGDDPLYVAEQAADPDSTLVIYMGLASLPGLAAKLMANGLSPNTPAAAVERGTTPQQRTVFGTLEALSELVAKAELVSPTLIFIGRVVALSPHWHSAVEISESSSRRSNFVEDQSTQSPALTLGTNTAAKVQREPRVRRHRGPDPALPSQL